MDSKPQRLKFRHRAFRGLTVTAGILVGVALLMLGTTWLWSAVGFVAVSHNVVDERARPSVVPALARIPWQNNPCRPKRIQVYPASLPGYAPQMGVVWWWTNVRAVPDNSPQVSGLLGQLSSSQPRVRAEGLRQFTHWIRRVRWKSYQPTQRTLLPGVLDAGHYRTGARMARLMILVDPANTGWVQFMLLVRSEAFLAARLPARALHNALRLYNICTMREVNQAVTLIAQCLYGGAIGGVGAARAFVAGQIMGAQNESWRRGMCPLPRAFNRYERTQTAAPEGALATMWQWSGRPYSQRARHLYGQDFNSLLRRGNLLLLANHCQQAAATFGLAYWVAQGWELQEAAEGIARTIKAMDKTVGRADAWADYVRSGRGAK